MRWRDAAEAGARATESWGAAGVTSRARVRRIRDRLREVYGMPAAPPHGMGLDELILTVLSQSTNDRNRDVAFLRAARRFGSWEAVRDAPVEEVEEAIRPGGISKVKSQRIQAILRALPEPLDGPAPRRPRVPALAARRRAQDGRLRAAVRLRAARDPGRHARLARGRRACGLFREKAPFEEMHDEMLAITPRGQELEFHVNLLRHGRRTCHARRPACGECALLRMCPTGYDLRHPD